MKKEQIEHRKKHYQDKWKLSMPFSREELNSLDVEIIVTDEIDEAIISNASIMESISYDSHLHRIKFESYEQYHEFIALARKHSFPMLKQMHVYKKTNF